MFDFMLVLTDAVEVAPVSPGLWQTIQENYAVVVTAILGVVGSISAALVTIKGGLSGIGALLAKKKTEGDTAQASVMEKAENLKTLTIRKGQLEVNKKSCEMNITNLTLKLDVINNPESRELIENQIAQEKAELVAVTNELSDVNGQLPSFSKLL